MLSLACGRVLEGNHWNYRIIDALNGDGTHSSSVFKAEIIPHKNAQNVPKWAIIKAALPEKPTTMENLGRERTIYCLAGVSSAACFRKIYDVIDNDTIALEWLDTTLAKLKFQPNIRTYALIKTFLHAALASCVILDNQGFVNTDYKSANILLSGIDTSHVTAKVGDLGLVFPAGVRVDAQPLAMRAPEVFLGQACTAPSQTWAIAAMLLCWIKPGVLREWDSPHYLLNEAWCMAKLKRLVPGWRLPHPEEAGRPTIQAAIKAAERFSREEIPMQAILPFQEEMRRMKVPQPLSDLLHLMLAADPNERPSASSVLQSKEFQMFGDLVDA